ncbi:intradiol ring-cleavage dioxygenase [Phyllobacterium zundukense]|uniref:Protocatechuate dioxygenase n=1 Tax=Phyllobacterium zundukense TaxID=1867719 RepID=A0A2N9VXW7_9HYPH|nr:intradiol ring-cleavage dioxygenase [Phyllobacterium zundukense]ATU95662.1 protocatechuate dioxygenase [Phyllobacterium zundukense]PIO44335.1 protocatechuate dioxygenase [Phyllobacterium zundukense]
MKADQSGIRISRRQTLRLIAVTAAGGAFLTPEARAAEDTPFAGASLLMPGAGICSITPEVTEGPFYFDPELERQDITEGREGVPLTVRLQAVDSQCRPLVRARVDIWHCDAKGTYSGYPGQGDSRDIDTTGQKYLRGIQHADEQGIVSFKTIYPGWYRGRTTHIHFKVFPDDSSVMVGQLFFPDDLSEHLFTTVVPYKDRPQKRDMFNKDDGIARQAGPMSQAALRETPSAYEALIVIAMNTG